MKIIISPAKKMQVDADSFLPQSQPEFITEASELLAFLKTRTKDELTAIWQASPKIVDSALQQLDALDLNQAQTPAIMAFTGIQYQYMAPDVLPQAALDYLQDHLRILSGLYGSLRPFDAISPYRLELQSKLTGFKYYSLYDYWQDKVYQSLYTDNDVVVNLASSEYSRLLKPFVKKNQRLVDIVFQENKHGKWRTAATHAKMSRGDMVRFMAERAVTDAEELKNFADFGYEFCPQASTPAKFVFRTDYDFKRK